MALASISRSLKSTFEGYIPQVSSPEAIAVAGAITLACHLYQKSLAWTLLAGAAFAATTCFHLRERVTLTNVEARLNQLEQDVTLSLQEGCFKSKKGLFISRFDKIQAVLEQNQDLIPANKWQSTVELMNVIKATLTKNPSKAAPLPNLFSTRAVNEHTLSFLGPKEVAATANVSRLWRRFVHSESQWKAQCKELIPGIRAQGTSYKQLARDVYPKIFGTEFYHNYYGVDVGPVPPIPPQFLEKADAVIFVPEYFTMTLPESSPLGLDQNGKLTENPNEYHNRPPAVGGKRVLQVPVTLNNLDILTRGHLKKGTPTGINPDSCRDVLQQHGNAHFPPHWSGQKRALMGKGLPFAQQQEAAQREGLEVVPLLDRVLFNLITHLRSGAFLENMYTIARTATVVIEDYVNPWQASVWPIIPYAGLSLIRGIIAAHNDFGVAVGVPSGSS